MSKIKVAPGMYMKAKASQKTTRSLSAVLAENARIEAPETMEERQESSRT
jgi:hypothetical protein